MKQTHRRIVGAVILLLFIFSCSVAAEPRYHDIRPGYGVAEMRWLSTYLPALKGTPGDTRVYVLRGNEPGGTMLVLGGTHENEISGIMAATWMVERLQVGAGTVFVIPRTNNSGSTYHASNRPGYIELPTANGVRRFAYGERNTNSAHQSPDPAVFQHPEGWTGSGEEARNLDRNYPGKADGNLTEQIAFAVMELIRQEKVDVAFDLHEAGPTSRLANMIVANPKSVDYAAEAVLYVEIDTGLTMKLEVSSTDFNGLSHREWGDHTQAQAFLIETPNPGQDYSRNKVDLVNDPQLPLALRMGTHLQSVAAITAAWNAANSDRSITWEYMPSLDEITSQPLGSFFND